MKFENIWGLAKPVIIIALCVIGYLFASSKLDGYLFTSIGALSVLFRGSAIWAGIGEIRRAISGKE